jgi:hypothetical protein
MISLPSALKRQFEERGPIDGSSVPANAPYVLGANLNRSESGLSAPLHCGISMRSMSGSGQSRRTKAGNSFARCPLYSNSVRISPAGELSRSANRDLTHCSKRDGYSITSSARANSISGMSRSIAFAVTRSNFVAISTGRSAGLPIRGSRDLIRNMREALEAAEHGNGQAAN